MWHPRIESEYPRKEKLGSGSDLTGEVVGWPLNNREVSSMSQTGTLSETAEQTIGDPLEIGQEAGDEQQEMWVCVESLSTGGDRGFRAHGCAEEVGLAEGGLLCVDSSHRWLHRALVSLSRRLQTHHLQSEAGRLQRSHLWPVVWAGSVK